MLKFTKKHAAHAELAKEHCFSICVRVLLRTYSTPPIRQTSTFEGRKLVIITQTMY